MPHVMSLADSRARAERVAFQRGVLKLSWSKIRDAEGFSSIGAVQQAYKSHRKRNPTPSGEFVFAELLDRSDFRANRGAVALMRAEKAGDYTSVASLIRALAANDADLAKWFGIGSETTVNVKVSTTATQIIAEAREKLLAVVDAEVIDPRELEA